MTAIDPNQFPLTEAISLLEALIREVEAAVEASRFGYFPGDWKLKDHPAGARIAALGPAESCDIVRAGLHWPVPSPRDDETVAYITVTNTLSALLRRKLPFDESDLEALVDWAELRPNAQLNLWSIPYGGLVKAFEDFASREGLSHRALEHLTRLRGEIARLYETRDNRRLLERIDTLLGTAPAIPVVAGEAWSDTALEWLGALGASERAAWVSLLSHCAKASGGSPSKKWLRESEPLVDAVGLEPLAAALVEWLPLVDKPRTQEIESWSEWAPNPNLMLDDRNADILKGLVWCASRHEDAELARALSTLAVSAYKKVPGVGPRAVKVGNASVWALGQIPGEAALAALAILKVRVKFGTAQKGIEKALVAVAEREGIPRDELDELGVPAYGLDDVGVRREPLGDFRAELVVTGSTKTELRWFRPDGKQQKSVPKAVSQDFKSDVKELRSAGKDVEKMLAAQRDRIDNLFLAQKEWPLELWRERYLDHPLVGTLARRIIWSFSEGDRSESGIWLGDRLVDSAGDELDWIGSSTTVRLWHPVGESTDAIVRWREWLSEHEISQPFKQAHREIYLLTDAERQTNVYSNRFAAHILKQHQFNALCAVRGWRNKLRLLVDDEYPPASLTLPQWGLRAEFWIEGAGDEYGQDTNESGTFWYLATDQVRFHRDDAAMNSAHAGGGGYGSAGTDRDENHPLPLDEIPPLVFSEVMRDVDLFVGVSSVGNDPAWADGGPGGRYQDYWSSYSFGELSETAATRKAVLEGLVPRLKIKDRCRIEGRFLFVRGDIRTYKIHLGSGNILMEPSDEYLCIVQSSRRPKKSEEVFLPFEGDGRLSLIISKAFLLANDTAITDATILSQIRG